MNLKHLWKQRNNPIATSEEVDRFEAEYILSRSQSRILLPQSWSHQIWIRNLAAYELFLLGCKDGCFDPLYLAQCPTTGKIILISRFFEKVSGQLECCYCENELHQLSEKNILIAFRKSAQPNEDDDEKGIGEHILQQAFSLFELKKIPAIEDLINRVTISKTQKTAEKKDDQKPERSQSPLLKILILALCIGIPVYFWDEIPMEIIEKKYKGFSNDEINFRVGKAIEKTRNISVVYNDILGEGPGAWDSDPRYPIDKVNCIVWVRLLLSEIFGENQSEKLKVMDQVRYYQGQVGFATRKHFGLRWMALDPGPFVQSDLSSCATIRQKEVELDLLTFLNSHGYNCPLYKMNQNRFPIRYVDPEGLIECASSEDMESGFYFLFAVPSKKYNDLFGKKSGPMGLVHGIVMELVGESDRISSQMKIFHASLDSGNVKSEGLIPYVNRMKGRRHLGYSVYRLRGDWNFEKKIQFDALAASLRKCEEQEAVKGGSRSIFKD